MRVQTLGINVGPPSIEEFAVDKIVVECNRYMLDNDGQITLKIYRQCPVLARYLSIKFIFSLNDCLTQLAGTIPESIFLSLISGLDDEVSLDEDGLRRFTVIYKTSTNIVSQPFRGFNNDYDFEALTTDLHSFGLSSHLKILLRPDRPDELLSLYEEFINQYKKFF